MDFGAMIEELPKFTKIYCGVAVAMAAAATWRLLPASLAMVCIPDGWKNVKIPTNPDSLFCYKCDVPREVQF